jgi:uncharacterized protein (TIGR02145 family)
MKAFTFNLLLISLANLSVQAQTDVLVDPRDGKEYKVVQIGNQTWMAENIKYYLDDKISKYYSSMGDSEYLKYGGIYDWKDAMKACPVGWHLPSKTEFDTLLQKVGNGDREKAYYALIPGGNSGFNALFYSIRYGDKSESGFFWSSTELKGGALPLTITKSLKIAFVSGSPWKFRNAGKSNWLSVRCIKNSK